MPSAVSPLTSPHLTPFHEHPKTSFYRHQSTSPHETTSRQGNQLLSALVLGQKGPGSKASKNNPSSTTTSKINDSIPSTPRASRRSRKGVQAQIMAPDRRGQKRKAHESLHSPPPRRPKQNNPSSASTTGLQDELLPTAQQHPDLPPRIFSHPKETIHNLLQHSATLSSSFVPPGDGSFLCRLSCAFADGGEVIGTEGRGTTRVSLAPSLHK